ncbi:MAG TPA: Na+/H+ antiporter subunit C [Nitrospiraceae bacterium]|nr:Na+/H+ antiporter subunit C [Nitrospiraceae bacterium]
MELMVSLGLGAVTACAVYLLLRARTFPMVLGLSLLSSAANVFIFSMGRLRSGIPPIVNSETTGYADPLPQALVLTAIVIGFGMTGFIMALAVRARYQTGSDHVDGMEPAANRTPADES